MTRKGRGSLSPPPLLRPELGALFVQSQSPNHIADDFPIALGQVLRQQGFESVLVGDEGGYGPRLASNEQAFDIPVIYVFDEVARIYQHSKRAGDEYSALSPTAKYCVGLARYTQSPLIEYAALGPDITAISFEEDDQHLVNNHF